MTYDPTRDYVAEVRDRIDAITDGAASYVPRQVAKQVMEDLQENHSDILEGFLRSGAEEFILQVILTRDRSRRSHARAGSAARAFSEAASQAAGDDTRLRGYLNMPMSLPDGSRQPLRSLRAPELLSVAGMYDGLAHRHALMASFLAALARRVGQDRVQDHFTESQLETMFRSLQ